jgi:hypothetical protein
LTHHKWTEDDDTITLYLYKFGDICLPFTLDKVADRLGKPIDSLKMRMANIRYVDKKVGLANVAKQNENIYYKHNGMPETGLRTLVLKIHNR